MKARLVAIAGLLLIDAGFFAATCAFLPQPGTFGHSGPWSYFVNSRARWDIAWTMLVAAILISLGTFLLLEALGAFTQKRRSIDSATDDDGG